MATSQFTQTRTSPETAGSHGDGQGITDTIRAKGTEALTHFAGVHSLFTILGKTNAVNAARVYHQKPGRVLENPFNQEYLDRLSRHELETAKHFYGYFTKLLLVQLRFKLRSQSLAEDAAQETLLRVLVAVGKGEIQNPERLPGFVRAVSENVAREMTRKNARFQQIPENNPEPMARILSAELNCITEESKAKLMLALDELNVKDRALLVNIYILERDKDGICQGLGIDRGSLRVRQFRALARLRKAMGVDHGDAAPERKAAAS